jgi:hypothetical protein
LFLEGILGQSTSSKAEAQFRFFVVDVSFGFFSGHLFCVGLWKFRLTLYCVGYLSFLLARGLHIDWLGAGNVVQRF